MTEPHRSPSTILWNTVLPGLGVALLLGTPMALALAVAAAVAIVIAAVLASPARASRTAGHQL
jgi:hypothetical protein